MLERDHESIGSCSEKLLRLGYSGIDPEVCLKTHNDHNQGEGSAPPIGRGLEGRLGVSDRVSAIQSQGGGAVLAMSRMLAKRKQPKRYYNRGGNTPSDTTYDPQSGQPSDPATLTLGVCQDELKDILLERGVKAAREYAASIVKAIPEWGVALDKQLEFEALTRGIKL